MFFFFDSKVMTGERDPAIYSVLVIMPLALFAALLAPFCFMPGFSPPTNEKKE